MAIVMYLTKIPHRRLFRKGKVLHATMNIKKENKEGTK